MSTVDEPQSAPKPRGDALRALLSEHLRVFSAVAFAFGVAGLIISELGGVHQLRVFAAGLVALGGIGLGIDAGLAPPRTRQANLEIAGSPRNGFRASLDVRRRRR